MGYLLLQGGQQYGPYEVEALRQMLGAGQINPGDLVWTQGMATWLPVAQVLPQNTPAQNTPPMYAAPAPAAPPASYAQPYASPAPAYSQPASSPVGAGPIPPGLHWSVVLIVGALTLGLFTLIWAFIEASFVKKISPKRNGRGLLSACLLINVAYVGFACVGWYDDHYSHLFWQRTFDMDPGVILPALGYPLIPVLWILGIVAIFRMRRGLLTYYNTTEPIQLRLGVFMTLFFSIYYFQYHLTRISQWKRTGQLAR